MEHHTMPITCHILGVTAQRSVDDHLQPTNNACDRHTQPVRGNVEGVGKASSVTTARSWATMGRLSMPQCASNRVEKGAFAGRGKRAWMAKSGARRVRAH